MVTRKECTPLYYIFLSIFASVCASAPVQLWQPYCLSVGVNSTVYHANVSGTFEAEGCRYNGLLDVVLSPPAEGTVSLALRGGFVAAGGSNGIRVQAPKNFVGTAEIIVTGITFSEGSVFIFSGSLSPNSALMVYNNSFAILNTNSLITGIAGNGFALFVGTVAGEELTLKNSSLIIANNSVRISDSSTASVSHSAVYVSWSSLRLSASSLLSISGNTILSSRVLATQVNAVRWYIGDVGDINITIVGHSTMEVSYNALAGITAASNVNVVIWHFRALSTLTLLIDEHSSLAISNNQVEYTSYATSLNDVYLYFAIPNLSLTISGQSSLTICNNLARNVNDTYHSAAVATAVYWQFESGSDALIDVKEASLLSISDNVLRDATLKSSANAVYLQFNNKRTVIQLLSGASFDHNNNSITNITTTSGPLRTVYWYYSQATSVLSISNFSTLSVRSNSLSRASSIVSANVVNWEYFVMTSTMAIKLTAQSRLIISDNFISGANSASDLNVVLWTTPWVVSAFGVSISDGSSAAFSGNTARSLNAGGEIRVVNIVLAVPSTTFRIANKSSFLLEDNSLRDVTSSLQSICAVLDFSNTLATDISLTGGSSASFRNNSCSDIRPNGLFAVRAVHWAIPKNNSISVADGSSLTVSNNYLKNTDTRSAYVFSWVSSGASVRVSMVNSSTISISNNMMFDTFSSIDARVIFWSGAETHYLLNISSNSCFVLSGNSVNNITAPTLVAVSWLTTYAYSITLAVSDRSSLIMSNNTIENSDLETECSVIHWQFPIPTVTLSIALNSSLVVHNNAIMNTVCHSGIMFVVILEISFLMTKTVAKSSTIDIRGNHMLNCSAPTTSGVVWIYYNLGNIISLCVSQTSALKIDENWIANLSSPGEVAVVLFSTINSANIFISISGGSSLQINGNQMISVRAARNARVVYLSFLALNMLNVTVSSSSLLSFSDNTMSNTTSEQAAQSVFWDVSSTSTSIFAILEQSTSNVSGNKLNLVDARGVLTGAVVLRIRGKFISDSSSLLTVDNNEIFNLISISTTYCVRAELTTTVLSGKSTLSLQGNSIQNVTSLGKVYAVSLEAQYFTADSGSRTVINAATRHSNAYEIYCIMFTVDAVMLFSQESSLIIRRSEISDLYMSTVTTPPPFVVLQIQSGLLDKGSSIVFSGSTLMSNISTAAFFISVSVTLWIDSGSRVVIENNDVNVLSPSAETILFLVSGQVVLSGVSRLVVIGNTISGRYSYSPLPTNGTTMLITAPDVTADQTSHLSVCGNVLFGDESSSRIPDRYLTPDSLASIVKPCSRSATHSTEASSTKSSTLVIHTQTLCATDTVSPSVSISTSLSVSATSTWTCRDLELGNASNICGLMRPMTDTFLELPPSSTVPASELFGASDCVFVSIPYSRWSGKQGSTHTFHLSLLDSRLALAAMETPSLSEPGLVASRGLKSANYPLTALISTALEAAIVSQRGYDSRSPTLALSLETAIATIEYVGKDTLNKVRYQIDTRAWVRCPIPMAANFEVTLEAADRIFPVPVANAVNIGRSIVSAGGGLSLSPALVARISVSSSLMKMSRCTVLNPDDQSEDGYDGFKSGLSNPFEIGVGSSGGARRYLRGALLMSVIYFCLLATLTFAYTSISFRIGYKSQRGVEASLLTGLLSGYPASLVAVSALVIDLAVPAGTLLGVQGDGTTDKVIGWLAVLACAAFVSHIVFVTTVSFPKNRIQAVPVKVEEVIGSSTSSVSTRFRQLGAATHKWRQREEDAASLEWLARYEGYIADTRVAWYCGLEQSVSLIVNFVASLPVGAMPFCVSRGVLCVLLLSFQTVVMTKLNPMVHRWRWILQTCVLSLQTFSAVLSAANAAVQQQNVELGMDALGTITFILLAIAFLLDIVMMLRELRKASVRARARSLHPSTPPHGPDRLNEMLLDLDLDLVGSGEEELPVIASPNSMVLDVDEVLRQKKRSSTSNTNTKHQKFEMKAAPVPTSQATEAERDPSRRSEAADVIEILSMLSDYESSLANI